ncbi:MAG: methyltransferase, partial [Lentisphaeria bacterium]|nr:methyltransferase [Lentisphaeria bacterium]
MDERIREVFLRYADEQLEQIIISKSKDASLQKVKIRPVELKGELRFQVEEFRGAQVFHQNLTTGELAVRLEDWFNERLFQAQISHRSADTTVLIGKKGTVTIKEKKRAVQEQEIRWQPLLHNREKKSLLPEGSNIPFLRDLGVFSAEGKVVKGKYDKFRQINRFLEFIDDVMPELTKKAAPLNILDFGCGKSYLTFAIYYYLTECKKQKVDITGLDLKADVIKNCSLLAAEYGYEDLHFLMGDVAEYKTEAPVD